MKSAKKKALEEIISEARKARLGDSLPEEERPAAFMISIGLAEPEMMEEEEAEEEDEEDEEEEASNRCSVCGGE